MDRDIGPATLFDARSHRFCLCWQLVLSDSTHIRLTDHNRNIYLHAQTVAYYPTTALSISARRRTSGITGSRVTFDGAFDEDLIKYEDFRKGRFRMATIYEYHVDWMFPFIGPILRQKYYVEESAFDKIQWQIEAVTFPSLLKRQRGLVYGRNCRHRLGDEECGVSIAALKQSSVAVTEVTENRKTFRASGADNESDNFWDYGVLTWIWGDNVGVSSEVKEYVNSTRQFELFLPMPHTIQISDVFDVYPGCNKTVAECDTKFSNEENFGGFPYIPGNDSMQKGPIVADIPRDAGK